MQPARKTYFSLLSFHASVLNFSASIGISATSRKQKSSMKRKRNTTLNLSDTRNACCPITSELQNRALAGVGRPMNCIDCLASTLKFARRKAEKAAIRKAVYGRMSLNGISSSGQCTSWKR